MEAILATKDESTYNGIRERTLIILRGERMSKQDRMRNPTDITKRRAFRGFLIWLVILGFLPFAGFPESADRFKQDAVPCRWTGVRRIVAVADVHGDFDHFFEILKGTGLIDPEGHWIGGETHLVQMGDVLDRGPDAKKVFDLIMKLEVEAERQGGRVHQLIGNHEEANIIGIAFSQVGFITVEQFLSFLPKHYKSRREKKIRSRHPASETAQMPDPDPELMEFWKQVMANDEKAQRLYIDTFNKTYGDWLLTKNAVIQINDVVFVHGGISVEYSSWKLEEINQQLRKELTTVRNLLRHSSLQNIPFVPEIIYNNQGPLWYRGLANNEEQSFNQEVDLIFSNLNARFMVIGHTVQAGPINKPDDLSRFQGRVWTIDTGISDYYGGKQAALIIEDGKFNVWGISDAK